MIDVASKELCEELYAVSGWELSDDPIDWYTRTKVADGPMFIAPKYNLGYLLRKLPPWISFFKAGTYYCFRATTQHGIKYLAAASATTPENAAAKLAIEMFEKGILLKEVI